jgi:hypothetical protein
LDEKLDIFDSVVETIVLNDVIWLLRVVEVNWSWVLNINETSLI